MDSFKKQQTRRPFQLMAQLGGLLVLIGAVLRLDGLLITATLAMALAGGAALLVGLIGLLMLRFTKRE